MGNIRIVENGWRRTSQREREKRRKRRRRKWGRGEEVSKNKGCLEGKEGKGSRNKKDWRKELEEKKSSLVSSLWIFKFPKL